MEHERYASLVGGTPLRLALAGIVAAVVMMLAANPAMANPPVFEDPEFYKAGGGPRDVVTADFDNDGDLDLANTNFFNSGTDDVTVFLNDGDGTYGTAIPSDAVAGVQALAAGDLDGDGNVDLVVTDQGDGVTGTPERFAVLLGEGNGNFEDPVVYNSGGDNAIDVALGDFDADGDLDAAIVNVDSNLDFSRYAA